jgi:CRP-like cAMP-binding protein
LYGGGFNVHYVTILLHIYLEEDVYLRYIQELLEHSSYKITEYSCASKMTIDRIKNLMHSELIKYCAQFIELTKEDINAICSSFKLIKLKRKEFLLKEGEICNFIAFINSGIIRHYHIKDGNEITCDITLSLNFITDYKSFIQDIPSTYNFQILKNAELLVISRKDLFQLYKNSRQIETLGRIMAEQVAKRTIDIAMSLASDKPEERLTKLLLNSYVLFQEVPQRYLANLIGISPESFSRIRARLIKKS